jgi:hypothetical protein
MRMVVAYRIPFIHDLVSKYGSQGWGVCLGRHSRAWVGRLENLQRQGLTSCRRRGK